MAHDAEEDDWAETFSRLTFWYGLSFEDLAEMRTNVLIGYLERLPARQAELKLLMSDAISIPHMKERARSATIKGWMRLAQMHHVNVIRPASDARLKLMGIGVHHVPTTKPG